MPKKLTKELTSRQENVLKFIEDFTASYGYPPTMKEIGDALGINAVSSLSHLRSLERKGYIKRGTGKPRAIALVSLPDNFSCVKTAEINTPTELMRNVVEIPIVGKVPAGAPILAVENIEGKIFLDKSFARGEKIFALRVKGNSMLEAHIVDGDFVIVREQATAEKGEIVVALIENRQTGEYEVTVKKYCPEKKCIKLLPCNKTMKPIVVEGDLTCKIVGKVIGVFRKM